MSPIAPPKDPMNRHAASRIRNIRTLVAAATATLIAASGALVATQAATAGALPTVVINEVESSGGTPGDWVELKNVGDAPVDVSGYIVKDDNDTRTKAIPANTTIAAGGYYTIDVEDGTDGFGLGGADKARLFLPDGTTLVDGTSWTAHAATTWGRCPDGTGDFAETAASTKDAANACAEPVDPADVLVINEVESSGGDPADWIELYNTGDEAVDAGGLILKDNDDTHAFTIPTPTTVAAGGYAVIVVDDSSGQAFGLGGADSARLFDTDGTTLVDSTSWTAHATTTWGRCPNGTGDFSVTESSTKGVANDCGATDPAPATPHIVINEVESSGGTPGDWVELKNLDETNSADLTGWRIRDNDTGHTANPFPTGTTIESGGYLVIEEAFLGFGLGSGDSATLFKADGTTVADTTTWPGHASVTWARCPDGTGDFRDSTASTKGTANDCTAPIRINEVESSGGDPGDWVELVNTSATAQDVGGMILKDNDDTHALAIPTGTTIAAGEYLAIDVDVTGGFGLGGADSARLFAADGTTLIDSYSWTAHASTTYGRCPDGTGDFATTLEPTKGAANRCEGIVPVETWPGGTNMTAVPTDVTFGGDLSGLDYETPLVGGDVIWAVNNGTGVLSKLTPSTSNPTHWNGASGWGQGKRLRYADGTGTPDAEGVTVSGTGSGAGVFVATERNNDASGTSRPSILRFDVSGSGSELLATNEWNLASDLATDVPTIAPNSGLEGITWIPDAVLTERGFVDESTGSAYDPADYPNHGTGIFVVALEATGDAYAYVLDLTGSTAHRVATIETPGAMELAYDPEVELLWAVCDEACEGRTATLQIGETGAYEVTHRYARPAEAANYANEGFTLAPQSACTDGLKPVYYGDDADTDGVSLRVGTIECTESEPTDPGTDPTDPGTDPTDPTDPTEPVNGGETDAPDESDLTPGTENLITGPATAVQGGTVTVQISIELAGEQVEGWIFSTPTYLGQRTVNAAGSVTFTIPASLPAGAHRLAVLDADGELIGWFALTVAPSELGATGADAWGGVALAVLLLAAGAGFVGARGLRRRVA
ncbi:lamin tail domain-containing protein [Homoserinibacter sp. GY 40078]|uniref:lamin tail domain-containing protein n=1 Tax=Homoserinibacter sp. GY 40078 TaxID=2603275 RepID=UPI0011CA4D09|nr:lamin tail domain-containing protein [Homoserinibacter sp. GY 40078]TXK17087.1 cell wall protein [Homoserinibacter sp. GY 40078]